jgi:hypothetical protein
MKPAIKKKPAPKPSELKVFDIPVADLIPDEDNPNQMDESTFDQLVEEIREQGFDEPVLVRPHPTLAGKYQIGSGHHRVKAATVLGMETVPAIEKHWTDREQKVALTKRNVLRGSMDKTKLVKLYQDLAKGRDPVQVQRELGFTDQKAFEKMYDQARASLPPKAQKRLDAAKETIKSVDDLSSVLNTIFKESGSQLDEGYMVFSFGGKKHHYIQIDKDTEELLSEIKATCESKSIPYREGLKQILKIGFVPERLSKPAESAKSNTKAKAPVKKKPTARK